MGKDIEMSHFGIDQQQEIKEGLQAGLDVSVYAYPEFYAIQMRQIRLGLIAGRDLCVRQIRLVSDGGNQTGA